jgi:hypothetical protein
VVFNVVCGRVRFNTIERGRTAVGRGARFGYSAYIYYIYPYRGSIPQADARRVGTATNAKRRQRDEIHVEASKSRVARGRGL